MSRETHKSQPMSRSFRVDDKIPQGPDAPLNVIVPISDDTRRVGNVGAENRWDNDRQKWVPYRGAEDHGVAFSADTVAYGGPLHDGLGGTTQESLTVLPTPSPPDIDPIPVYVVHPDSDDSENYIIFRTGQTFATVQAAPIIGRQRNRTKLKVRNLGPDTIYLGQNESLNPTNGFPLSVNSEWNTETTEELYALVAGDVEVRRNFVPNPSVELALTGWASNSANYPITRVVNAANAYRGSAYAETTRAATALDTTASSIYIVGLTGLYSLKIPTKGQIQALVAIWNNTPGRTGIVSITFYDVFNAVIGTAQYSQRTVLSETGYTIASSQIGNIPDNADSALINVAVVSTDGVTTVAAGEVNRFDAVYIGAPGAYFDGDTTDDDADQYAWSGVAKASSSIQYYRSLGSSIAYITELTQDTRPA
jgi:hypothetical protein